MKVEKMNKRYLLWVALVIAAVIAVRPMLWLGIIGFAGFMVVLAVFVGLVVTYLLSLKKGSVYREIGFGVLIIVTVCAVIALKFSAPELNASEVKEIFGNEARGPSKWAGTHYARMEAISAEYKGDGIWRVKVIYGSDISYRYYDENTEEIKRW